MYYREKVALFTKTEVCVQSIKKISIKQQTIWHSMGNALISWKMYLGGPANELTMPDIKCAPIETKETLYCVFVYFQLSNTWKKHQKKCQHENIH